MSIENAGTELFQNSRWDNERADVLCAAQDAEQVNVRRWQGLLACVDSQVKEALARERVLGVCEGYDLGQERLRRLAPVPAG